MKRIDPFQHLQIFKPQRDGSFAIVLILIVFLIVVQHHKVIFDLYNYMDESNQSDYLKILDKGLDVFGGEILLFHMKDCLLRNGAAPKQVPLGTGDLDMEAILRRIKTYDKNAILTLEGTTGGDILHAVNTIKDIWERV